jgi:hypothetical protein
LTPPSIQTSLTSGHLKKRKRTSCRPSDKEGEPLTQASGKAVRRSKRTKNIRVWAETEFSRRIFSDLDTSWQRVQTSWIDADPVTTRVAGVDYELGAAVAQFKVRAKLLRGSLRDGDLASAIEIEKCWNEVDRRLEKLKHLDAEEKDTVDSFSQALRLFVDEAELYEPFRKFPDFIDREDEIDDKDFKN